MAQADASEEKDGQTLDAFLKNNKLDNSELRAILGSHDIDTADDLKTHFEESDDIDAIVKAVRKRTEKILANFSKKIVQMTGIDYEYKAPRRRAKGPNLQNSNSYNNNEASYLSPAESPRGGSARRRRKRTNSNTSVGSNGSGVGSSPRRKSKGQPAKTGKEMRVEANAQNATLMKQWLQRRNIFNKDLFDYLATHSYNSPDDLVELTEKKFDYIVREVRVETFKEVNDSAKRKRVDKLLTKFEKEWRKYSGIRKTNMTKEQQELWGYSPVSSRRGSSAREDGGGRGDQPFFGDDNDSNG